MAVSIPPVVLFGYESSPFTTKIRMVLKLKQIPYTFVIVTSMMPRPVLRDNFNLTYRKIPVLAIGQDVYIDTSMIIEALEHRFSRGYRSAYPKARDGRDYRPLMRGFASYWIDRPFFRVTTGLIPSSVWRTEFGKDRAGLIGHKLDPQKLEAKVPQNMSNLDMHLSIFEPLFQSGNEWIFSTPTPSVADIALYYQLQWGFDIAAGRYISNLTGGGTPDTNTEGASMVFNPSRYPALHKWFLAVEHYFAQLPAMEIKTESADKVIQELMNFRAASAEPILVPTTNPTHHDLDKKNGLVADVKVSVAPDDTGRNDPTIGTLVALSPEEIIIKPIELESPPTIVVLLHFPRLGFVVKPWRDAKL